jgi:hypothetical protein
MRVEVSREVENIHVALSDTTEKTNSQRLSAATKTSMQIVGISGS